MGPSVLPVPGAGGSPSCSARGLYCCPQVRSRAGVVWWPDMLPGCHCPGPGPGHPSPSTPHSPLRVGPVRAGQMAGQMGWGCGQAGGRAGITGQDHEVVTVRAWGQG